MTLISDWNNQKVKVSKLDFDEKKTFQFTLQLAFEDPKKISINVSIVLSYSTFSLLILFRLLIKKN